MNNKDTKASIVSKVGKLIREEVRVLCSNRFDSILKSTDSKALCNFKCEMVIDEMKKWAPTLLSVLKECTKPQKVRAKREPQKKARASSMHN